MNTNQLMMHKVKAAVCSQIRTKPSTQSEHHVEFLRDKPGGRGQLKYDGTRAETRFRLSSKRTSPFKSSEASVQSTIGSRVVRTSGSNAGYTMFRGSVKSTGYSLHSPVSSSLPLPCVTVCHHISTGLYVKKPLGFNKFFRASAASLPIPPRLIIPQSAHCH